MSQPAELVVVSPAKEAPAASTTWEAMVTAVTGPRSVRLDAAGESVAATVATVGDYRPSAGDRVLAMRSGADAWVLGVIGSLRVARQSAGRVSTRNGTVAEVEPEGERLTVRDAKGEVLFVHDATTGKSTVVGRDLSVRARGDLSLEADRRVNIVGEEVEIRAKGESLSMGSKGTEVRASELRAVVDEARLTARRAAFVVERVESAVHKARTYVDVAEVHAGRIVERAKDVFRDVEGVSQTRAGRIRVVAKGVYHLLSERATIKAHEDLSLMGEKINLA